MKKFLEFILIRLAVLPVVFVIAALFYIFWDTIVRFCALIEKILN